MMGIMYLKALKEADAEACIEVGKNIQAALEGKAKIDVHGSKSKINKLIGDDSWWDFDSYCHKEYHFKSAAFLLHRLFDVYFGNLMQYDETAVPKEKLERLRKEREENRKVVRALHVVFAQVDLRHLKIYYERVGIAGDPVFDSICNSLACYADLYRGVGYFMGDKRHD